MDKDKDLKIIREFSKLTIQDVCKEAGVDRGNLLTGRASAASTEKVKKLLKDKIDKIFNEK